jgi:hypothetical protein
MESQPAPAASGVLAHLNSHLDWYWTLSPPGRVAFWATFGGWALDVCQRRWFAYGKSLPSIPEVGAVCGKAARTDLRGGREVTRVPTATLPDT